MGHKFTALEMINVSGIITSGPCVVHSVTIAADGANGDCDLYDGVNANAPRKGHLEALSGTTFHLGLEGPALFNEGIYIVVNAATTFVMVEYQPISRQEAIQLIFEVGE